MAYKIYIKSNYLVVENTENREFFYGHRRDVLVDKNNLHRKAYRFFNVKDFDPRPGLRLDQILKQDGTPYTLEEWETFYLKNTGSNGTTTENPLEGVSYIVENYTELITTYPSAENATLAYVFKSQGIKWINYKPAGYYIYSVSTNSWENYQKHLVADELLNVNIESSQQLDDLKTATGTISDSAWSGTGNSSIISALKGIFNKLTGTLTVDTGLVQPLTDSELRATPIDVNTDTLESGLTSILNKIIANPATLSEQQTQTDKLTQILALSDFQIQMGLVSGVSKVLKSGRNSSVTSSSVPEDIWNGSTVYTGFPTGAPEVLQFFSSNAGDTGVVTYFYLATSNSTAWQTATVTLNGTTPVTGVSAYRVHSASYDNGGTVNLGTITCRHSVTTANVFFQMPIGTCQTYVAVYTVPAGSTAFIKKVQANVSTTNSITLQGALYIREFGKSPRLRRNFDFSDQKCFFDDDIYLKLNEKTDITVRITSSSSNTAQVIVGNFELILINQIL